MTPEATARASADSVAYLTAYFMIDGATFARGAELGFTGIDFYVAGRGGVLGDVDADVVSAAFALFEPAVVRTAWEASRAVMPRHDAAVAFAECGDAWARAHLSPSFDAAALAEVAGKVVAAASPMLAPVFAGWRALPLPSDAPAVALRHMNALRELRFAVHAAALLGVGLSPVEALSVNAPYMLALFGWPATEVDLDAIRPRWVEAEAMTDRLFGASFGVLSAAEREAFVALAVEAKASATSGSILGVIADANRES